MNNTLIVVVAARITDWIDKGEIPEGYFNPVGRFSRIIIVSLVKDSPSKDAITHLAGAAKSEFHSISLISPLAILTTLGLTPMLVASFLSRNFSFRNAPNERIAVRSYGDAISGLVAVLLADRLGCRSLASIHTSIHQDNSLAMEGSLKLRLLAHLERKARRFTHRFIDVLTPVYSPAVKSVPPAYHHKTVVVPNVIELPENAAKLSYSLNTPVRLITVGRLIQGKTITPLIEMLEGRPEWHLTVIGNGPLRAQFIRTIRNRGLSPRISMISRLDNIELLESFKTYDIFVAHTKFEEIPKTVIEAGLVGLPILLNKPSSQLPTEYENAPIEWVDMQTSNYQQSLDKLVLRDLKTIGFKTRQHFESVFNPEVAGKRIADLLLDDASLKTDAEVQL
ncbi:glycosyltransferase family 4 protein [Thalassospira sp. HF15]|uniref:glycosyltransferase family 4 protein n=1 Tax=Thalassospira sp. HF15 TaxID=2722755 RepID=UPI001431EA7C|nr:glycosyltransferase family 4 protein [Thalassospira sp. HF15]NIY75452.1 glycosyltransferase family 4 protein [Thalassospira sp. HF15]